MAARLDGKRGAMNELRGLLWFSLPQSAFQGILAASFAAVSLYLASRFLFHVDETLHWGRRGSWLVPLLRMGDGAVGAVLLLACSSLFLWWSVRAGWRFFTPDAAVMICEEEVRFHRSYGANLAVNFADFEEVHLYEEVPPKLAGLIPPIHTLRLSWTERTSTTSHRKQVKIRANTIEGGRAMLEAFGLEARTLTTSGEANCT